MAGGGQAGKLVVRVDYQSKVERRSVVTNAVRTGGILPRDQLTASRYVQIRVGKEGQPPGGAPRSP